MSTNSGTIPPIDAITPENHSPIITIFYVCFLLFSVTFLLIRLVTLTQKRLEFGADDVLIVLCLLLAISQGVAIGFAVHYGLGKHVASRTATQISQFFQAVYSSQILAAASMGCAKFSVALLYRRLEMYPSIIADRVLIIFISICTIFSLFALVFECGLPTPWLLTSSNCPDRKLALAISVSSLNCLSDAVLVVYPFFGIIRLRLPMTTKITVLCLFSTRLLACAMSIIDLIFTVKVLYSSDSTWEFLPPVITGMFVISYPRNTVGLHPLVAVLVNVSLISATVPRIHSFLATIPTGQTSFRLPSLIDNHKRRLGLSSHSKNTKSPSTTSPNASKPVSASRHSKSHSNHSPSLIPPRPILITRVTERGSTRWCLCGTGPSM